MTDAQYVENEGRLCPFCGHDQVVGDKPEVNGTTVTLDVTCSNSQCEKEWHDRYALVGYNQPDRPQPAIVTEQGNSYPELYSFARDVQSKWEEKDSIDWQDAEDLIQRLRNTRQDEKLEPMRSEILAYCDDNEDWDSEDADKWPSRIMGALESTSAGLMTEQIDDECHVFNLRLSGKKEWTASFTTENLAIVFISFYQ
jgi:hypothetical protein